MTVKGPSQRTEQSMIRTAALLENLRQGVLRWNGFLRTTAPADVEGLKCLAERWSVSVKLELPIQVLQPLLTGTLRDALVLHAASRSAAFYKYLANLQEEIDRCGLEFEFYAAYQGLAGLLNNTLDALTHSLVSRSFPKRVSTHKSNQRNRELAKPLLETSLARFCRIASLYQIWSDFSQLCNSWVLPTPSNSIRCFGESLPELLNVFEAGAGWLVPTPTALLIVPLPQIKRDQEFRLHSVDSPAVTWFDGITEYWWHGVRVDPKIIKVPESLTLGRILAERNVELRRIMMECATLDVLLKDAGAEKIHSDRHHGRERQLLRLSISGDEPIVAVRVTCPSTGRNYVLRVPPNVHSCNEAIAWTFGLVEGAYHPAAEA